MSHVSVPQSTVDVFFNVKPIKSRTETTNIPPLPAKNLHVQAGQWWILLAGIMESTTHNGLWAPANVNDAEMTLWEAHLKSLEKIRRTENKPETCRWLSWRCVKAAPEDMDTAEESYRGRGQNNHFDLCFICDKAGHWAKGCLERKHKSVNQQADWS